MCLFTIYVCVCVFVWYMVYLYVGVCVVLGACTCISVRVEARGQYQVSFLVAFHLIFLECESLSLEVTNSTGVGWAGSSRDGNLLVSDSLIWDFRIPNFSYRCWGSKHRSSLCSKHFTTEPSLQSLPFVVLLLCLQIFHQS